MIVRATLLLASLLGLLAMPAHADPARWRPGWPRTDFARASVPFADILSGGPPKDGIPAIDEPRFRPAPEIRDLADRDPVISVEIEGDARAYPLRVLTWHEIVNDRVGGRPVIVTYCPLCNAAIAFERRIDGRELGFGVTGKLRHSDMIMYDRETESWWQQYTGEAIVGALLGRKLPIVPSRLESFALFRERHPDGQVLVPSDPTLRPYGANPYVGYEDSGWPFLYRGEVPERVMPLERVVVVGAEAWPLSLLQKRKRFETGDLLIEWLPGQASALDTRVIAEGRDVGNVIVRRRGSSGTIEVEHKSTFAFVFFAFQPDGTLHTEAGPIRRKP
ncbi:MAG: DUF3179 domain-containing protein [Alphaproteobacteria bacterium]|nr:DUF3179 domain-containing protein [Alphaproteobacteria bacterium]